MLTFIVRRLLAFIPMLLVLSFLTFTLSYYGPGDPVRLIMGENWSSEEVYRSLRHQYGLDRPLVVQFGDYLWSAMRGDFGRSYQQRVDVGELLANALPVSAQLALASIAIITVVGIGLGILSALYLHRWPDATISSVGVLLHSVPAFVLAPVVLVVLVLKLDLVPTPTGWHGLFSVQTLIAASIIAASPLLGVIRQTRTSVADVLSEDFVRTARAKGLNEWQVMATHVMRNALAPVTTSLGLTFGYLLGGSIFVESAFAIPGLGQLFFSAIRTSDYPLLTGATIVSAFWIMLMNLLVDVLYGLFDPRVRAGHGR
jgi:ABC-type dipeptide/oligopeptide/nickel transport system permease component